MNYLTRLPGKERLLLSSRLWIIVWSRFHDGLSINSVLQTEHLEPQ